jgi:ubiquinone/menaquinone biosynthesis C-methylase UbiE
MERVFYHLMRIAYDKVYGRQHMLHYPLDNGSNQDLLQGQIHFTRHCLAGLPDLVGKRVLDVGCGNGVQTIYIHEAYRPEYILGVDINDMHIGLATAEKVRRGLRNIDFAVDNAQLLSSAGNNSFDVVICTESAHHYADKGAFFRQVARVLRPNGYFLIAELLRRDAKEPSALEKRLSLFYWPRAKYREALTSLQLAFIQDEDITDLILPAFAKTGMWFEQPNRRKGLSYRMGRLFGRGLIKLYSYQLTHSLRYELMLCRKG